MTNNGVVKKLLPGGMAEVAVIRQSACGGNCASCGGCSSNNVMTARAHNLVNAKTGQSVVIESSTKKIFGAVALVYVMPLIFFLASYIAADAMGLSEGICVLASFLALAFSGVLLVLYQRFFGKKREVVFNIIEICER